MICKASTGVVLKCLKICMRTQCRSLEFLSRNINIYAPRKPAEPCRDDISVLVKLHILSSHNRNSFRVFSQSVENRGSDVNHNASTKCFYIDVNGLGRACLEYEIENKVVKIMHTKVPKSMAGRGYGKLLAKEALEYIAKNDFNLEIHCEYVQHYVSKYAPKYIKYLK